MFRQKQKQEEKEEAYVRALFRKKPREQEKEETERVARDMAETVMNTFAQAGMMKQCLESVERGPDHV